MNSILNLLDSLSQTYNKKEVKQIRDFVPIERWIESPFYIGEDGARLYDPWKQHMANVFNGGYSEVILTGSLGSGKSTVSDYCLIRKIYELSIWDKPALLFNMLESTILAFMCFSITLRQAEATNFGKIRRIIDTIPYFKKYFQRNPEKNSIIEFPGINITYGSDFGHQLGLDLIGTSLDESNFMGKDKSHIQEYDKATELYTSISNRRLNRFVIGEKDLGLSIVVSSAADPTAFVETRIREAEAAKKQGNDYAYIANVVSYEVKRKQYSADEFCVFLGTDIVDPCIIDCDDDLLKVLQTVNFDTTEIDERLSYIPIIKRHLPKDLEMRFKFVPTTFRRLAEQNITKFIQDVIGHSGSDDNKLFKNRDLFKIACEGQVNLFHKDTLILSMNDKIPLSEYFDFKFTNPSLPRFIHVDQAVVRTKGGKIENRLGMSCAYVSRFEREGDMTKHYVDIDFLLAVNPPERPDRIPLFKIKEFIIWLRNTGLNIGGVTFDQFQSEATIQELTINNIKAERYSVDKDDKDWLNLVNLYYEKRLRHPFHKVYFQELFKIEHDNVRRKCDHPSGEFKDVCDAVVGSVAQAILKTGVGGYNVTQFAQNTENEIKQQSLYDLIRNNHIPGMI